MDNSINEPSNGLENDKEMLREWLMKQPHLPKNFSDDILSLFIKGTKSLEIAKKKLDNFCTTNAKYADRVTMPPVDAVFREKCEFVKVYTLPDPLPDGSRVVMTECSNVENYNQAFTNRRLLMMFLALMRIDPDLTGILLIADTRLINLALLQKLSINESVAALDVVQNTIPLRLKLGLLYNANPAVEMLMNNFVMPFMSKKMQERVVVTSEDASTLKNHIPVELLPCDYGGKAPSTDKLNEDGIKLLESHEDWFAQLAELKADEEKRPPDTENSYGMDGTFRKLNVD